MEKHTVCGILMHSSLVVTTDGLPLGLCAIKFWNRQKFKGTNALKRKINPARVPIEEKESFRWLENLRQSTGLLAQPERCVHIGDRESGIYAAIDGIGIAFVPEHLVRDALQDGRLERVLTEWCPSYPGLRLYYPGHIGMSPVAFARSSRRSASTRNFRCRGRGTNEAMA